MSAYYVPFKGKANIKDLCDGDQYLRDLEEDADWNAGNPDDYFPAYRSSVVWRTDGSLWIDMHFGYESRGDR